MPQESRSERPQEWHRSGNDASGERSAPAVLNFPDPALNETARSLRSDLNAVAVAVALQAGSKMVCRARAGNVAPDVGTPVPTDRGITAECIAARRIVHCADTTLDPRVDRSFAEAGIRSILVAPLLRNNEIVGVLVAFFTFPDAYNETAVWRLEEAARQIIATLLAQEQETLSATTAETTSTEAARKDPVAALEPIPVQTSELTRSDSEQLEAESALLPDRAPRRFVPLAVGLAVVASVLFLLVWYGRNPKTQPASLSARAPSGTASSPAGPAGTLGGERVAAEAGDAAAQFALAHAYRDGAGAPADPVEAQKWLRRAAEGGYPDAQLELAGILETDKRADPVEAYTWYVIAWQSGNTEAESAIRRLTPKLSGAQIAQVRYGVGKAYATGTALPHDAVSAYVWYALAEWGGDTKARDRLKELDSQLTPDQLAEAKSRAATWIRRHTTRANPAPATPPR